MTAATRGASSSTTCAFVPPTPNELTPARRGVSDAGHGCSLAADVERAVREIDARIRRGEMERGRNLAVLQREDRLDQAGHARRRLEVPDVSLHRAERAELLLVRAGAKGLGQRRDLDRIAERRAGAVRLDVADRAHVDAGQRLRGRDRLGLAVDARRHVADLGRAVVVHREAADDRVDVVAVAHRLVGALQHDQPDAVAENRAARRRHRTGGSGHRRETRLPSS